MRVVQFEIPGIGRRVGVVRGDEVADLTSVRPDWKRLIDVFHSAEWSGARFPDALTGALELSGLQTLDYKALLQASPEGDQPFLHPPVDAADPHRVLITGTGLTHLGSMKSRDSMHAGTGNAEPSKVPPPDSAKTTQTDSAKMFQMGIEGGKPPAGERGVAPEWFYKGNGTNLRGHRWTLDIPNFTKDGGEEAELVGCYVIDNLGTPRRLGFALGNEWSDHATERINYLYLAPSKLRQCAVGPELLLDFDFQELKLHCRVLRRGGTLYDSGELLTGERHMCHSLANCEDHHFKFPQHRQPGDVHLHFFGTSKLSYGTRQWVYEEGDEIQVVPETGAALVNTVHIEATSNTPIVAVKPA